MTWKHWYVTFLAQFINVHPNERTADTIGRDSATAVRRVADVDATGRDHLLRNAYQHRRLCRYTQHSSLSLCYRTTKFLSIHVVAALRGLGVRVAAFHAGLEYVLIDNPSFLLFEVHSSLVKTISTKHCKLVQFLVVL